MRPGRAALPDIFSVIINIIIILLYSIELLLLLYYAIIIIITQLIPELIAKYCAHVAAKNLL